MKGIILKEFEGLSPTILIIIPNWQDHSLNSSFKIERMTPEDLDDLEKYAAKIRAIAPMDSRRTIIRAGSVEKQLSVTGTNSNYIDYVDYGLQSGRIITDQEVESREKIAIVGNLIQQEFFPG